MNPPKAKTTCPNETQPANMHHLHMAYGIWCLRFTIEQGPKYIGKRVKMSLGTRCPREARRQRRRMFRLLREGGVTVVKENGVGNEAVPGWE